MNGLATAMLAGAMSAASARMEECRKNGHCFNCGDGFVPEENVTKNPLTGETRVSAFCPKCRREGVNHFMQERSNARQQNG